MFKFNFWPFNNTNNGIIKNSSTSNSISTNADIDTIIDSILQREPIVTHIALDNLEDYQYLASRTCPDLGNIGKNNLHMIAGVFTEFGEAVDAYKKHLAYKKNLDLINVFEEIADAVWYLTNFCRINNIYLPEIDNIKTYRILSRNKFENNWEICDEIMLIHNYFARNPKLNAPKTIVKLKVLFDIIVKHNKLDNTFYSILEKNIRKLMIRFPDNFDEYQAENRNLELERKELEK